MPGEISRSGDVKHVHVLLMWRALRLATVVANAEAAESADVGAHQREGVCRLQVLPLSRWGAPPASNSLVQLRELLLQGPRRWSHGQREGLSMGLTCRSERMQAQS